jgi:hypothetical protein
MRNYIQKNFVDCFLAALTTAMINKNAFHFFTTDRTYEQAFLTIIRAVLVVPVQCRNDLTIVLGRE